MLFWAYITFLASIMPFNQEFIIFPLSSVGINLFTFVLVLNLTLIRITWCPVYLCWKGWEISALLFFTAHNIFPVSWESLLCCGPGLSKEYYHASTFSFPSLWCQEWVHITSNCSAIVSQSSWRTPAQIQLGPGHLLLLILSFCHMLTYPLLHPLFFCQFFVLLSILYLKKDFFCLLLKKRE